MITFQGETLLFVASFAALYWAYRIYARDGAASRNFAMAVGMAVLLFVIGILAG